MRNNYDTRKTGEDGSSDGRTAKDVLDYIADMLAQLEILAERHKLETVSDILGFSRRQVDRTRNR